jgi:hypothetical protein
MLMAIYSKDIHGMDELIKAFERLPEEALVFVENGSYPPTQKIIQRARRYLEPHINTGTMFSAGLRANRPTKRRKYKYTVFSKVFFARGAAHGVPLELGHNIVKNGNVVGYVPAYPFLRPAADESKGEVIEAITKAMNEAIDKMGGLK